MTIQSTESNNQYRVFDTNIWIDHFKNEKFNEDIKDIIDNKKNDIFIPAIVYKETEYVLVNIYSKNWKKYYCAMEKLFSHWKYSTNKHIDILKKISKITDANEFMKEVKNDLMSIENDENKSRSEANLSDSLQEIKMRKIMQPIYKKKLKLLDKIYKEIRKNSKYKKQNDDLYIFMKTYRDKFESFNSFSYKIDGDLQKLDLPLSHIRKKFISKSLNFLLLLGDLIKLISYNDIKMYENININNRTEDNKIKDDIEKKYKEFDTKKKEIQNKDKKIRENTIYELKLEENDFEKNPEENDFEKNPEENDFEKNPEENNFEKNPEEFINFCKQKLKNNPEKIIGKYFEKPKKYYTTLKTGIELSTKFYPLMDKLIDIKKEMYEKKLNDLITLENELNYYENDFKSSKKRLQDTSKMKKSKYIKTSEMPNIIKEFVEKLSDDKIKYYKNEYNYIGILPIGDDLQFIEQLKKDIESCMIHTWIMNNFNDRHILITTILFGQSEPSTNIAFYTSDIDYSQYMSKAKELGIDIYHLKKK